MRLRDAKLWTRVAVFAPGVCVLVLAGCGVDLGACDTKAADEVVYSAQGLAATKGQALMYNTCGEGAFCHSSAAKGKARYGAPAGLDFDMLPSPLGWPNVIEKRSDIWQTVLDGNMPPPGMHKLAAITWSVDPKLHADAPTLPLLASKEGKGVLRNWLACNAPLVAQTHVPSWVLPPEDLDAGGGGATDFHEVYMQIMQPNCALSGCHDNAASGGLSLTDECTAYRHLLQAGVCGRPRVVPGDSASLLLSKLDSKTPVCGGSMPPVGQLPGPATELVRAWIDAGAPAENCK